MHRSIVALLLLLLHSVPSPMAQLPEEKTFISIADNGCLVMLFFYHIECWPRLQQAATAV